MALAPRPAASEPRGGRTTRGTRMSVSSVAGAARSSESVRHRGGWRWAPALPLQPALPASARVTVTARWIHQCGACPVACGTMSAAGVGIASKALSRSLAAHARTKLSGWNRNCKSWYETTQVCGIRSNATNLRGLVPVFSVAAPAAPVSSCTKWEGGVATTHGVRSASEARVLPSGRWEAHKAGACRQAC